MRILLFVFILLTSLYAENTIDETTKKIKEKDFISPQKTENKVVIKNIKDAVNRAVENSPRIKTTKFDLIKADSSYLKNQSQYAWKLLGNVDANKSKLPFNQNNLMTGTKTQTDIISGGIERLFETGTYFKIEVSSTRFDSNAFEDPNTSPATFRALGIPPLYTGKVIMTLSQELLKNSFGIQQKNYDKVLQKQAEIQREELAFTISDLIVQVLVDYWSYNVAEASVKSYERLLRNSRDIRNLTQKKLSLGLSEKFEVNQWNALVSQAETQLEKAKLERDTLQKKLIRTLNLPEDTKIEGFDDLKDSLPTDLSLEKDLEYAYKNRSDWKNLQRQKEMAEYGLKIAENNSLPTLRVAGNYGYQSQNLISPQKNYLDSSNGILSYKYPTGSAQVTFIYPIADKGIQAGIRDANIQIKQLQLIEMDKKREIEDDIRYRIESLKMSFKAYKNSKNTRIETERYYSGLYNSFKQGRFAAVNVKNALDSLIQNELAEIQAKINFNIELLRYELAKNALLEKYEIDLNALVAQ